MRQSRRRPRPRRPTKRGGRTDAGDSVANPAVAILFVGRDRQIASALGASIGRSAAVRLFVLNGAVADAADAPKLGQPGLVIAEVDARSREQLAGLQKLIARLGPETPVIALADGFDDAIGRAFLQMRVADFFVKPVQPGDVAAACHRLLSGRETDHPRTHILTFLPACGGVGNTTLAIEAARQYACGKSRNPGGACLVNLDFHSDSCAEFLDLEARLNFKEAGEHGERLDGQLLQAMLSKHESGLFLLAAPGASGAMVEVSTRAVQQILEIAAQSFAAMVIDLPRAWQPWTDDVLAGSDETFVVTDMTVPGLRSARRLADRIVQRLPNVQPKVIVNRFQPKTIFGPGLRRSDAERALGPFFGGSVSNNYALVREAIDRGALLETVRPSNNVSLDLAKIIAVTSTKERS